LGEKKEKGGRSFQVLGGGGMRNIVGSECYEGTANGIGKTPFYHKWGTCVKGKESKVTGLAFTMLVGNQNQ